MRASIWEGGVDGPGLYLGVPAAIYHADPCPDPSLSSSIARVVINRSLAKAKAMHPRLAEPLGEDDEEAETRQPTRAMDIGSAAHSLAFGFGSEVVPLPYANWRTKQAKADRQTVRDGGEIPLKVEDYKIAKAMADRARPVISDLLGGSLVAEAMVCWQERGFWRRGLIDRMSADARVIIDLKTTGLVASPVEASRAVYASGHHFQEAFYRRGLDAIDPEGRGRRRFCFLYQEQEPPFELALVEIDEAGRSLGDEQIEAACNLWDRALATDHWPGYPFGPHIASPPPWMLTSWALRAETDETLNAPEFA
jgi:hypothetical protein